MISVAIMAHPKRSRWVPRIVDRLDHDDVRVVWDAGWNDRHITGLYAMQAYDPAATHHLILQDDILICRDLIAGVRQATTAIPADAPMSLYIGRVRPSRERVQQEVERSGRRGIPWVVMPGPWWGPGIVLPTHLIDDLAGWYRHQNIVNYDRRVSAWFERRNVDCWYTLPSLVEHRHGKSNPSLIAGRIGENRRAWQFIGQSQSALDIDWTPHRLEESA